MFPRSTHETFAEKLYQTFRDHKRFSKPKLSRTGFTIHHYAGDVTYQTENFLDKNKDYVVGEHQALLSASRCSFVSGLFPPLPEESSKTSKFSSIGSRFKQQLQSLLETLSVTEPHYVRCVKPNNLLKPSIFENQNVLQQLRCGGVMEAIRISCAGFPTRKLFNEFLGRFIILGPEVLKESPDEVAACKKLLEKIDLEGSQVGKTKVFLRAGQMAELDARRNEVLGRSACIIQRKFRSYLARERFKSLRNKAILIQALCRGTVARLLYESLRKEAACLIIQQDVRMFLARKSYKALRPSAVCIQAGIRGMAARCDLRFRRRTKAAIHIQSHYRGSSARQCYRRLKRATIVYQCAWRGLKARRELRRLKMEAKETGALQEAKSKLEKEVEELTWRLQLEKRMRADNDEAKSQENAKLHAALEEMKLQFRETKELLVKEREAAKLAAEKEPIIKEVPVIDHELVDKLTSENENLKDLVNSLEKEIDETKRKYEETSKHAEEAESQITQLKTNMQRLEEKVANLESTEMILRKEALRDSSSKNMSGRLANRTQPSENGHLLPAPSKMFASESLRRSQIERQREHVDALMKCITQDVGFSEGKPVAAFTIYKCLLHWKSFEAEKTNVFDRLIQMIGSSIEDQTSNEYMAYWLSNTSSLLFLLQQTLKSSGSTPQPTSLFGRMFRSSPSSANLQIGGLVGVCQVEAKYPALLFKQQLTAYVEKIYGIIRDNVKRDLSPILASCIQAPKASRLTSLKSFSRSTSISPARHWQGVIECLNGLLSILKDNYVPSVLVQKIFTQLLSYINVQLFNSLLLRRECCTFSNGEYVKTGLGELEIWCGQAQEEYAGSSWEEMKHLRQAVGFLVIHQKSRITYDDLISDLCPILSIQQLYRICTLYCDDQYNTRSVSPEVISSMKQLITEDSNEADDDANSFLLDDNSSIPFSVDDISSSIKQMDFTGVKPAPQLSKNPDFQFLYE